MKRCFYVIKDEEGHFVPGDKTFIYVNGRWIYRFFTGITSGFVFFDTLVAAKEHLNRLLEYNRKYNFGKIFCLENTNRENINEGELLIGELISETCTKKIVNI